MHRFRPETLIFLGLAAFLLSTSSPAEVLYQTNFDSTSERPAEWKITGASAPGNWVIQNGNLLTGDGDILGDSRSYVILERPGSSAWKDYTISVDVWMSQRNGAIGLVGRWQSQIGHYEGSIEFNEGVRIARIVKSAGNAPGELPMREVLAQGDVAKDGLAIPDMIGGTSSRDSHRLSLSFNGSTITLSIDGESLLSATDSTLTTGTAGIMNWRNFAYYDNIVIESGTAVSAVEVSPGAAQTPSIRVTPRFTPAPRPTPPMQAEKLKTITRPVPESILKNMDLAELKQRLTKEEQAAYDQMSEVDQYALLRNIRTRMITSTGAGSAQMAVEIENLKKQLAQLSNSQKEIADNVSKRMIQDKEIADAILTIDTLRGVLDYAGALAKANEILQKYPDNPLLLEKKKGLERLMAGTYEGYDTELAKNETRYNTLAQQAQQQESSGNLEGAIASWTTVIGMSPSKDEWLTQANAKISALSQSLSERKVRQDRAMASIGQNRLIVYGLTGLSVLVILIVLIVLIRFHKRSQMRDQEILSQVKDLTQPLVDMQAEIRQLTGTGMLALPNLSADDTPSEGSAPTASALSAAAAPPSRRPAPVPQTAPIEQPPQISEFDIPAEGPSEFSLSGMNLPGMESQIDQEISLSAMNLPGMDSHVEHDDISLSKMNLQESQVDHELDGAFDFEPVETAAQSPEVVEEKDDDFDPFKDLTFAEPDFGPVSSPESEMADGSTFASAPTSIPKNQRGNEETVAFPEPGEEAPLNLGLDDLLAPASPKDQPVPTNDFDGPTVKLESGALDLDLNAPLDLNLQPADLDFSPDSAQEETVAQNAFPTEENSIELFQDDSSDSETQTSAPVGKPEPITLVNQALGRGKVETKSEVIAVMTPGVVFEQDFEEESAGSRPQYWTGEEKENVAFHIVESNSSKVLRYFKNAGTDSVHFFCRFPDVGGVVSVDFDLCCPQKNKYLLGLYIERDGNYNQAVRTVIHCIDPSAASIRMQNEPVNYVLGDWCHVRYLIDLNLGQIDGFIDGEQVLTQQTFVNKPSLINTLSIRDNHATTGELLIDNIRIEKLA